LSAFVDVVCCGSATVVVVSTRKASALASGAAPNLIATNTTRLVKQTTASQTVLIVQDPRISRFDDISVIIEPDSGDLATPQRGAAPAVDTFTDGRRPATRPVQNGIEAPQNIARCVARLKTDW
jgi:hypothetical protein